MCVGRATTGSNVGSVFVLYDYLYTPATNVYASRLAHPGVGMPMMPGVSEVDCRRVLRREDYTPSIVRYCLSVCAHSASIQVFERYMVVYMTYVGACRDMEMRREIHGWGGWG